MDVSETYEAMCEKATEIQALNQEPYWRNGDSYYSPTAETVFLITTGLGDLAHSHLEDETWLPHQDQLQQIFQKHTLLEAWRMEDCFNHWLHTELIEPQSDTDTHHWKHTPLNSMEQLWLAFVMKEKYNKLWGGEDWRVLK